MIAAGRTRTTYVGPFDRICRGLGALSRPATTDSKEAWNSVADQRRIVLVRSGARTAKAKARRQGGAAATMRRRRRGAPQGEQSAALDSREIRVRTALDRREIARMRTQASRGYARGSIGS